MRNLTHQGMVPCPRSDRESQNRHSDWSQSDSKESVLADTLRSLLPTLPNGNRHIWTNTSKWVTSEDVTLGRLCSYSSDAAIIQNIAIAKLNNLRALALKMKMPSEPKPTTLSILTGIKAHHLSIDLTSDNPEAGKANSKKPERLIKLGIFLNKNIQCYVLTMFSSSLISEADSKREIYVLRSGCVTRTKVTIFKGRTHLEAQSLLCVFKRKFSLSVILKEAHMPFTISTNTHTYVHHSCLEARSLPFCRKNNCSDFLTDFSKKSVFYVHTSIHRKRNMIIRY